jgi:DHA1 family multidrug resistance protein-like MFS transporter
VISARWDERHVLPLAMFFGSFSWSFVYISLPFHIQRISTWDAAGTLTWTGWIMGITPLATVATAPLWGRHADRGNPKTLYAVVLVAQGIAFLGTAVARTLMELFVCRAVLGVTGAASTFAFVSAGRSDDPRDVRRQVAAIQSGMTIGQVIGPLVGAIAAARLGFRASFVVGAVILFGCGALVRWGVPDPTGAPTSATTAARPDWRDVLGVAGIVLGGSTQIFFLTSILPQILPALGIADDRTLEVGGLVIFASAVAAALGSVLASRLADLVPERRLVPGLLVLSSVFVIALAPVHNVWVYGALRFLQVLCIAPVFPLAVARIAQTAGGVAIGIVNSARIGAAFIGPVLATTLLAWSAPTALYAALALVGLACVPMARAVGTRPRRERHA